MYIIGKVDNKIVKTLVTDVNQTHSSDHFVMYKNIKSLCCTPETNIF